MSVMMIDTDCTHTVHGHEDVFMPEENHMELVLIQTTHFESYQEAAQFAEKWQEYMGKAVITNYQESCTCAFCNR